MIKFIVFLLILLFSVQNTSHQQQDGLVVDPEQIEEENRKQQQLKKQEQKIHKEYEQYIKELQKFQRQYEQLAYQSQQNQKKDDKQLDSEMRIELQKLQQNKLSSDKKYQQKVTNIYSQNASIEDKKKLEEEYRKLYLIQEIRHDKTVYIQLRGKQVLTIYEDVHKQPTLLKVYFIMLGQQAVHKNSMIQVEVISPTKKILETKQDKSFIIVEFQARKKGTYTIQLTNMKRSNIIIQVIQEKEGKYDETMKRAMFILNRQKNHTEQKIQNMSLNFVDYEKVVYIEKQIKTTKRELERVVNLNSHHEDQFNYFFDELEYSSLDFQRVTIYECIAILILTISQVVIFKTVVLKNIKL